MVFVLSWMLALMHSLRQDALVMDQCAISLDASLAITLRDLKAKYMRDAQELVHALDTWSSQTLAHADWVDKSLDLAIDQNTAMGSLLSACFALSECSARLDSVMLETLSAASSLKPVEVELPRWPLRRKWNATMPVRMWIEPSQLLRVGMQARVILHMPFGCALPWTLRDQPCRSRVLLLSENDHLLDILREFEVLWPDVWSVSFKAPFTQNSLRAVWIQDENVDEFTSKISSTFLSVILPYPVVPALALREGGSDLKPLVQLFYSPHTEKLHTREVFWEHDMARVLALRKSGKAESAHTEYSQLKAEFWASSDADIIQTAAVSTDGRYIAIAASVLLGDATRAVRVYAYRFNAFEHFEKLNGCTHMFSSTFVADEPTHSVTMRSMRFLSTFDNRHTSDLLLLLVRREPGVFDKISHRVVICYGVLEARYSIEADGDAIDFAANRHYIVVIRETSSPTTSIIDVYLNSCVKLKRVHTRTIARVTRVFALSETTFCCYNGMGTHLSVYLLTLNVATQTQRKSLSSFTLLFQYDRGSCIRPGPWHFLVTGTKNARHFLINCANTYEYTFIDAKFVQDKNAYMFSEPEPSVCSSLFSARVPFCLEASPLFITTVVAGNVLMYTL